jgi:hypothetical protein
LSEIATLSVNISTNASQWEARLDSDVFELIFTPENASEMVDLFKFSIKLKNQHTTARMLLQQDVSGKLAMLWQYSEDNSTWLVLTNAPNSTDPTEYSIQELKMLHGGTPLWKFALLLENAPIVTVVTQLKYSRVDGSNTALDNINTMAVFDDSSGCVFTVIIAQNQITEGTVVEVTTVDPSTMPTSAGMFLDFVGSAVQVNSSNGILSNVDFMYTEWVCSESSNRRRLLNVDISSNYSSCEVSTVTPFITQLFLMCKLVLTDMFGTGEM